MQKRIYNFEKIRGVDVNSSPINVAPNRASYMMNMISDGGTNKKRHGWEDIAWFEYLGEKAPINGVFKYNDKFVVHAGEHFFLCDRLGGSFRSESCISVENGLKVANKKSKGYVQDGKLWIVGAGDYMVYDGEKIQPVMNSMYAYVPTTSIGILPGKEYNGKQLQGVNLLQKKRKNKLIGQATVARYKLDSEVDITQPVRISIEYQEIIETVTRNVSFSVEWNEGKAVASATDDSGNEIEGLADEIVGKITVGGEGIVIIRHSCVPALEGDSNITVEFTAKYDLSLDISCSGEVTIGRANTVLSLVNNKNVVYFSDYYQGYGYFPDNDYICVGEGNEPVTALVPLDVGIGVFKKESLYRVQIDVNLNEEKMTARLSPSLLSVHKHVGCENEFCALNVNGDGLIYNKNGVSGVVSSSERIVNRRSTNIECEIVGYGSGVSSEPFAVSHEGRYYLFLGGKVYIADTRFKTYESNRLDSSYEYEWWIWDNCSCRCAFSLDGKLYMGTDDGTVRAFTSEYYDTLGTRVLEVDGDVVRQVGDFADFFVFDDGIGAKPGDLFTLGGVYEKFNEKNISTQQIDGITVSCTFDANDFNRVKDMMQGFMLHLYSKSRFVYIQVLVDEVVYDEKKIVFMYNGAYQDGDEYDLVRPAKKYLVSSADEGQSLFLVNEFNKIARFTNQDSIRGTIKRKTPVACEMVTGAIDFAKLYSKSLYKLAVTPTVDTCGQIEIGYRTNLSIATKNRMVGSPLDFGNFDFESFVFDGSFLKTFVKRVFERNFNYVSFRFASKEGPFGIENAQAVYSINNELRGDL